MFTLIRPLFPYLRRYKRDYFWGGLSIIFSNAIAVLFPLVVAMVIDGLNTGVTKRKVLIYSGMLLGVTVGKGIFLFIIAPASSSASRAISSSICATTSSPTSKTSPPPTTTAPHRRHHGPDDQRPQRRPHAARPGHHVQRQQPRLHRGALLLHAPHQPVSHPVRARPAASRQHPRPVLRRSIHRRFERIQAMFSDISAKAQENFSGARLIRAFAQEDAEIASFEKANQEYIGRSLHLVR